MHAATRTQRVVSASAEAATLQLFIELCRQSAPLRSWLWGEFGRDPAARTALHHCVCSAGPLPERFLELTPQGPPWRQEVEGLKARHPRRVYGGRTRQELDAAMAALCAGRLDVECFLLAHALHRAAATADTPPALRVAATEFLRGAYLRPRQLRQLERALDLARRLATPEAREALGYGDWWKLNLLVYILHHPRPAYRIRELKAHLATLGMIIPPKELQRFCTRYHLQRDTRPGRPVAPRQTGAASPGPARPPSAATRARRGARS
jgi:hypothetical protein